MAAWRDEKLSRDRVGLRVVRQQELSDCMISQSDCLGPAAYN